ncbi:FKBP-type peptidyl-prolyl cis-trans isomerase [Entomobacter blattae]|uniref:Peptidyl-prolyl cis-trans isomerase n=1 Tax=Entomobacter blattae TaxID=2762277 RepID=A0A7H1NTN1_9PROT|nr:FKBP-type peptidyl-prolyl cis-trans isomerase [Entomobacter blattae]QNT79141.1 FKBP-type peptidyl-prolyl cis-trans isomerase [Entomobacter blattae]
MSIYSSPRQTTKRPFLSHVKKIGISLALASTLLVVGCSDGPNDDDEPDINPTTFMQHIRSEKGVVTLPSGLAYKVIKSGDKTGISPQKGDLIMVSYEGRLPDGIIFDSSNKHGEDSVIQMELDGMIDGWMQALPMMHTGDTWMLYVPPELGYKSRSVGVIPPNSPLIFSIQLVGVDKRKH